MVAIKVRDITEAEKAEGFKSIVFVRPAEPTLGKGVVEQIDPATGEPTGQTFDPVERRQFAPGGRRGTGFLFISVPATPKIKAQLKARESKEERAFAERQRVVTRKEAIKLRREELRREEKFRPPEEKKGIKLIEEQAKELDVIREEETKPISRLETFSPLARERLGITETPEGLLEVKTTGDRKIIVTGRKEPTIVPTSAEFMTGFESKIGGIDRDEDRGLGRRFKQFKAIGTQDIPIITGFSKDIGRKITDIEIFHEIKVLPITTKIFRTEGLVEEEGRLGGGD